LVLQLRGVSKTFGVGGTARRVLQDVSLSVAAGELMCLTGANGAGKSTLLRIIATLLEPDAGIVELGGHPVTCRERAFIGLATGAERSFQLSLTGRANLMFWGELCGISSAELRTRVSALAEELGVEPVLGAPVADASQGTRDRLAMVRALLHRPRLLLLDEPTRSQDASGRARILRVLERFVSGGGAALIATHEPGAFKTALLAHLEQGHLTQGVALSSTEARN
jgi:ABC-2 type transport system ATP-binding protein